MTFKCPQGCTEVGENVWFWCLKLQSRTLVPNWKHVKCLSGPSLILLIVLLSSNHKIQYVLDLHNNLEYLSLERAILRLGLEETRQPFSWQPTVWVLVHLYGHSQKEQEVIWGSIACQYFIHPCHCLATNYSPDAVVFLNQKSIPFMCFDHKV